MARGSRRAHPQADARYDGTDLVGWQRQATGDSVQGLLEEALARIDGAPVTVHGAGGPTPACTRSARWPASRVQTAHRRRRRLRRALNAQLPPDVRVARRERGAAPTFTRASTRAARPIATASRTADVASPFERATSGTCRGRLDVDAMREAARALVGRARLRGVSGDRQRRARTPSAPCTRSPSSSRPPERPPPAPRRRRPRSRATRLVVFEVAGGRVPPAHGPRDRRHAGRGRPAGGGRPPDAVPLLATAARAPTRGRHRAGRAGCGWSRSTTDERAPLDVAVRLCRIGVR